MPDMRSALTALLAATALLLTACSSDDTESIDNSEVEAEMRAEADRMLEAQTELAALTALRAAVDSYSEAFLAGDAATAYGLLSSRCQNRIPLSEFTAAVERAEAMYGPQDIASVEFQVNGAQAQATYAYELSELDQTREPWVDEDGWRNDDC